MNHSARLSFSIPRPQWRVWIVQPKCGGGVCIEVERAPNLFHRWMQRFVLGFKWERIKR